jgi:hypothetical protein
MELRSERMPEEKRELTIPLSQSPSCLPKY